MNLRRILETPALAKVVPQLQPELLHQIIQAHGLEACSEVVALATPEQLARVFDLDLWKAPRPGVEETLDAARFGEWLDVLMEAGPDVAGAKLCAMDPALTIAALSRHMRVFDRAAAVRSQSDAVAFDIGPYTVEPRRHDAWSTIVDFLIYLDAHRPGFFHVLMRGCRDQSNEGFELDGLDNLLDRDGQDMFDLTVARESRLEGQGYIAPEQAKVFLQMSREVHLDASTPPPGHPIATAYFRALDNAPAEGALVQAGVQSSDMDKYGFLANALVAGCPIQGRAFTPKESADATEAICALGREHWPASWGEPDLLAVFQVGWTVLHRDVAMHAAGQLIEILGALRSGDSDIDRGLAELKKTLTRQWRQRTPWQARQALDAIMMLDPPAWAALLALVAECPVLPAGIATGATGHALSVDPTAFEFIASRPQIAAIHRYLDALPSSLCPQP